VAVDLFGFEGLHERFLENLQRAGLRDRVTILEGLSKEVLPTLEPQSFDLIYIDASHVALDVMRDAILSWELLKDDGYLVFDDYIYRRHFPAELRPQMAIDAFVAAFRDELLVVHRGLQVAVQRRKDPCPGACSTLGPYEYHWNWKDPSQPGSLYDPRTKARVPLSVFELSIVEGLLRSRASGSDALLVRPEYANDERIKQLREKLDI
jgi:hypothetical protein